ncbi:MAG: hypothetical protein WB797_13975 [Nocardioides sp.]
MRVRRTLAALLAVPTLLLSGCGGDSSVTDPPVSSGPTSAPPTTQPPAHESPQHFIRRWAAAEKQMENTGNVRAYLDASKGCRSCEQLASDVTQYYAAGGFVKWSGWKILSIRPYSHGQHHAYAMHARAGPTVYKTSAAGDRKTLPGGVSTDLIRLARTRVAWRVVGFTKLGE